MKKFRRIKDRATEWNEEFAHDPIWQKGYEFDGDYDGNRIAEANAEGTTVRWHLAEACEEVP